MRENETTYCLYCRPGYERRVGERLSAQGLEVIPAVAVRHVVKEGIWLRERRPVLPGCVFFSGAGEPDRESITRIPGALAVLRYRDGTGALRGPDAAFVRWLRQSGGLIGISTVEREGSRIRVVDGPLKAYEERIVKVNARQKNACIELEACGAWRVIWLSYEYASEEAAASMPAASAKIPA
jgi:transcriptional antiterminator NusG